jgi:hypothetical protein
MAVPLPQLRVQFLGAMDPIILVHIATATRLLPLPFLVLA